MKKMIVLTWSLSAVLCAGASYHEDLSASQKREIKKIRKELQLDEPTPEEKKLAKIREELGIKETSEEEKQIEKIRRELHIGYEVPIKESRLDRALDDVKDKTSDIGDSFDDAFSSVKDKIIKKKEPPKEKGFSFQNSLSAFQETLGMDLDESWGISSLFGTTKKKKENRFLGSSFLGDIKDSGTSFYQGAKYSGQSAQMMSGMMYNSSKMYNTMFGVFDDSPFNVFEEEEEASMFDVFEHGNSLMEMFE